MPIYEYACEKCGSRSEFNQSIHDVPIGACPECRGKLSRIISGGSGFIVKGSSNLEVARPRCGKDQTCCGNVSPCESPHCGSGA
jgi:putative FmdB family regulatory protein